MGWVGRDLADHLVGKPSTRAVCSKPHPSWPGMFLGIQHPLPPSGQPVSVSHHPHHNNFLPFYLNLPIIRLNWCYLEFPCSVNVPCHWEFLQSSSRAGSAAAQAGKGWKNVTPGVACEMITLNAKNPAPTSSAATITAC